MENEWLGLLSELHKKPVIPLGLLLPPMAEETEDGEQMMQWLDEQRVASVIYVAFGSETMLSNKLIQELAFGLEHSNVPFLWALRRPESMLPPGFEERIKAYGVVAKGWVPQLKILAHNSVGGFLTLRPEFGPQGPPFQAPTCSAAKLAQFMEE